MGRAKTWSGLWGNIKFLFEYKTWATWVVVGASFAVGFTAGVAASIWWLFAVW